MQIHTNITSYCHYLRERLVSRHHQDAPCKLSCHTDFQSCGFFCQELTALEEIHPLRKQVLDLLNFQDCGKAYMLCIRTEKDATLKEE